VNAIRLTILHLFLPLSLTWAAAEYPPTVSDAYDWEMAGQIAVQSGGRIKPLDSYAGELVKSVCGKSRYAHEHPVETYFHWMSDGEHWASQPLLYLPKGNLRERLGLEGAEGNFFSLFDLQRRTELHDVVMEAQARQSAGEKLTFTHSKALDLLARMQTLGDVFAHEEPRFVPVTGDGEWRAMPALLLALEDTAVAPPPETEHALALGFVAMYNSLRDERADIFTMGTQVFVETQREMLAASPKLLGRLEWELRLNRLQPFLWAKLLLALSLLIYLFSFRRGWTSLRSGGLAALILGWILYTSGMALRAYIAGRAPWSNMYESLLAIGWALTLIAIIFEAIRRDRVFAISGAILGALVLGLAQFASLDRGINPLVPALQSYWLNYHVITTLTGYACLALAMAVGHAVLVAGVRSRGEVTPTIAALAKANLRIVQIGTLFLISGILLGAVWANASWGRFWGWDPKETWALICWFVYIILLHGRSAGWLAWRGMAIASVAVFPVVIMTYYGVNYYLSGLHSYGAGSSPGIPWQVFAYLGAETLFLAWAIFRLRGTGRPRPPAEKSPDASVSTPASEVAS